MSPPITRVPDASQPAVRTGVLSQVVSSAGEGDLGAFAVIYDKLAPVIWPIAVENHGGDHAAATEWVSERFLSLWRALPSYSLASTPPLTFLLDHLLEGVENRD